MKTWVAGGAAIALLISASAMAEDQVSVRVPATASYKMPRAEFRDYSFRYELSNDKSVRFIQQRKQFFAEFDGEAAIELFPVAPGVLVTAGGARLEFASLGAALTIHNYERLPLKVAMQGQGITVASR